MRAVGALLGCAFCAVAAVPTVSATAQVRTHHVIIDGMRFTPAVLTVQRGDRVLWTNNDLFVHTVTADAKVFDSKNIEPKASWTYVAQKTGQHGYLCTLHPAMQGTLTVREDASATR